MALSLDKALLSFLVFAVIVSSGVFLLNGLTTNYDQVNLDNSSFVSDLTNISGVYGFGTNAKDDIVGGEVDEDTTENSLFLGGFRAVRGIFLGVFTVPGRILKAIFSQLNLPPLFYNFANALFVILLTFSIIYLVFRFRDR